MQVHLQQERASWQGCQQQDASGEELVRTEQCLEQDTVTLVHEDLAGEAEELRQEELAIEALRKENIATTEELRQERDTQRMLIEKLKAKDAKQQHALAARQEAAADRLKQAEKAAADRLRQAEEAANELLEEEEAAAEKLQQVEARAAKKREKKAAR